MSRYRTMMVAGLALVPGALQARPATMRGAVIASIAARSAEVAIYSAPSLRSVWSGVGDSHLSADLCVASTTGRYRLEIRSLSGGALSGPGHLPYTLRFRDGSGIDQSVAVRGQSLVTFEGHSPDRADCSLGANAALTIETTQADMLGQAAGTYADRLTLSAQPI